MHFVGIGLVGLGIWGYQESGSVGSQLNEAFSGSPSDNVMIKYVGAAISIAIGAFLYKKN